MGYTTDFDGGFSLNKALDEETKDFLHKFSRARHFKIDVDASLEALLERGITAPKIPSFLTDFGNEGEFFDTNILESNLGLSVLFDKDIGDYNNTPKGVPSLWCQWIPSEDGTEIVWDQGEKFYEYEDWLVYLIDNFLAPQGYILNGYSEFRGEDSSDHGYLVVTDNKVRVEY